MNNVIGGMKNGRRHCEVRSSPFITLYGLLRRNLLVMTNNTGFILI